MTYQNKIILVIHRKRRSFLCKCYTIKSQWTRSISCRPYSCSQLTELNFYSYYKAVSWFLLYSSCFIWWFFLFLFFSLSLSYTFSILFFFPFIPFISFLFSPLFLSFSFLSLFHVIMAICSFSFYSLSFSFSSLRFLSFSALPSLPFLFPCLISPFFISPSFFPFPFLFIPPPLSPLSDVFSPSWFFVWDSPDI